MYDSIAVHDPHRKTRKLKIGTVVAIVVRKLLTKIHSILP